MGNSLADWARMNVLGLQNTASFNSEPDIKAWSHGVALNPSEFPPEWPGSPELDDTLHRLQANVPAGVARLAELSVQTA